LKNSWSGIKESAPLMLDTVDLIHRLSETRARTLALVAPYSDEEMEKVHNPLMSPLVWDLAHIAAYEDLWLVHRIGGRPLSHPELAAMYDAFESPREVRGSLPLLNHQQALEYMGEVRERSLDVVETQPKVDEYLCEMVLRHEQQHTETMLQTIELAHLSSAPGLTKTDSSQNLHESFHYRGYESLEVPGGPCLIGAEENIFAYDNERPLHEVDVPSFRIGLTPVTNSAFQEFVNGDGYDNETWWSPDGLEWKNAEQVKHPGGWRHSGDGWEQWRVDGWSPLNPEEPVVHVSWFEADAFARAHGARLPTEDEWEKAARWDSETGSSRRYPWGSDPPEIGDGHANVGQSHFGPSVPEESPAGASPSGILGTLGDVWEWTSTPFHGYPGFVAYPYKEYSEVFFGSKYKVLRGGSWATQAEVATPTFRNWDLPERRQIFSGFRLAWDN
jgi:iron(II)-dependent oxidoreductase